MTLLITPLNSLSNLPQLPTIPLYLPTTSNHSTVPSPATPDINSGTPCPSTNSDLLKTIPVSWSTSNRTSHYEEILFTRLRIGHTRLIHSFLLSMLSPSLTICRTLLFMSCPYKRPPFSLCLFNPLAALSNNQEAIPKSLAQLPSFHLFVFLHLHLNPLFLSEPITLSVVARFVNEIIYKKRM